MDEEKKDEYLLDHWLNQLQNSFLGRAWQNSFWESVWKRMTKSKWIVVLLFFVGYVGVKMGLDGGVVAGAVGVGMTLLLGVVVFAGKEYYERETHPR